ncbi:hypothetical protein PHYSODRAFT_336134 [Phytophthora sojae]|uniref:Uncharacterized protein n=1 Tax=Phytophthora sojae (strain P6497) TaxID=1094619 RepID=G4ZW88_PHYSP|nr:hypothetical protein PHYSODRAFT_336134 [Phytophthora sojae]EGZ11615.1 hypothetical protein PHYSODRAFT_336134 [Phytophthora sojae]|eukprot:XP_009531948.1 hypothetical protein PHYSODRAFT_336134 [Phytophthora sojae]
MTPSSHYLQGVSKALPGRIQALPQVCDAVNLFAMPSSLDDVAGSGRLELVREYFDVIPSTFQAIAMAAAEGHLHVVQWIYSQLSDDELKKSTWGVQAFKGAACSGQLGVLEWLKSEFEPNAEDVEGIAALAAATGRLAAVQWVMDAFSGVGDERALTAAVIADQREVEAYLTSICDNDTRLNAFGSVLETKAVDNDSDRVEELAAKCKQSDVRDALTEAIDCDAYDVVELLWGVGQGASMSVDDIGSLALERTVHDDRLDIAALYVEAEDMADSAGAALREATAANRLDFVELLYTKCEAYDVEPTLDTAAAYGFWDIVKLVYDRCSPRCVSRALRTAASCCRWDVVEVLCERCEEGCSDVGDALKYAAAGDELEMVKLLYQKSPRDDVDLVLGFAVENELWDMVRLVHGACSTDCVDGALKKAAEQSRWDLVEVLYVNAGEFAVGDALVKAAETDQWGLVKLMHGKCRPHDIDLVLKKAASSGQRDVVELLYASGDIFAVGGAPAAEGSS